MINEREKDDISKTARLVAYCDVSAVMGDIVLSLSYKSKTLSSTV